MIARLYRLARSPRLAHLTMGALAVLVGAGTIIPQRLTTDPSEYEAWRAGLPWLAGPAETLALTDVYRSPLFLAVAGLLTLNLIACTWKQVETAARRIRPREASGRQAERAVEGRGVDRRTLFVPASGDHLRTGGRVVRHFQQSGYSPRSLGPGRWECRRRWWGHACLPAFHLALLLVIAGALVVSASSFRGTIELAEGQGFVAGTDAFLSTSRGVFGQGPPDGWAVRLDAFRSAYHENGQIRIRESDISLRVDGSESSHLLASSHPVAADGYRVYQSTRFGWAPYLRLTSAEGRAQEGFVNLAPVGEPEAGADTRLHRQEVTPPGTTVSVSLEYKETLGIEADDAGPADATVEAVVSQGDTLVFSGPLAVGRSVELPDGAEITFLDLRRWSGLVIVGTPGLWLVYLGGALSLAALLLHFTVIPERIRVIATRDPSGVTGYRLVGWRRRYGGTYAERLWEIGRRLQDDLGDDNADASDPGTDER